MRRFLISVALFAFALCGAGILPVSAAEAVQGLPWLGGEAPRGPVPAARQVAAAPAAKATAATPERPAKASAPASAAIPERPAEASAAIPERPAKALIVPHAGFVYSGPIAASAYRQLAGVKRHPTIEDNVVIYGGSTILGGQTVVGHDSTIGGNVWLTKSIPENSVVYHDSTTIVKKARRRDEPLDFII